MAKTRKRARTKTARKSSKRAKPVRRRAAMTRTKAKPGHIELRPIRTKLKSHVSVLGSAIGKSLTPRPELEEALKRMSRWLDDIQEICGPDMMIPVS